MQVLNCRGVKYVKQDGKPWFEVKSLAPFFTFRDIEETVALLVCEEDVRFFTTDEGDFFTISSYGILSLIAYDDGLAPPGMKFAISHEIIPNFIIQDFVMQRPIVNEDDVEDIAIPFCGIKVFDRQHWDEIKKHAPERYGFGYVYIAELGGRVKIGCSQNPYARLLYIDREARCFGGVQFGRVAVTQAHSNYHQNETILHRHFKNFREASSEFFNYDFDNVVAEISEQKVLITLIDSSKRVKVAIENLIDVVKTIK